MTDNEYLDSLDTVQIAKGHTVTIPLDLYNRLLASHAKLSVVVALYKNAASYEFREVFGKALEIKGDKPDA